MPCTGFACELIRAYPGAKIIINKRTDIEAWYQSVLNSFDGPDVPEGFSRWRRCVFERELFWMKAGRDAGWGYMVGYDFPKNGREVYHRHYAELEELLAAERKAGRGREVLEWQVQDGWEPLAAFLKKQVPTGENGRQVDFPRGNGQQSFIDMKVAKIAEKVEGAEQRKRLLLVLLPPIAVALAALPLWQWSRS